MSQDMLKDFFAVNNNSEKYFLMPIAIVPFGSGKYTLKSNLNNANNKHQKIEKVLSCTLLSMQVKYKINYMMHQSSRFKTKDKGFNALLDKSLFICSFNYSAYKVLVFVCNSDEVVFAIRKKKPFGHNEMELLYIKWLKNKYKYITNKLKEVLEFFYRTYKFNFKKIVTRKKYFHETFNYAYYIVYTNTDSLSDYQNYRVALLDPSKVIYSRDEINHLKESEINQRILNLNIDKKVYKNIEERSDYRVYFSWSTGLIEGNFALQEFFEYILIEVELQKKWNGIYKLTQMLRVKNRKISLFNEVSLAKLEMFTVRLNSLNDAGDSERLLVIKEKIIESSRIFNLIDEYKYLLSLNQQLNVKYLSLAALFVSSLSLILTIIFNVIKI